MREMRLRKRAVTDAGEVRQIIEECQVLRLGLIDDEGMFIVPVNFGYAWDEKTALPRFYVHSAREGRKAEAVLAGGTDGVVAAFELDVDGGNIVGDYSCAYSRAYASVMGCGRVREVVDAAEREDGLRLLMAHAAPGAPAAFAHEGMARVAIFRLDVERLSAKRRS